MKTKLFFAIIIFFLSTISVITLRAETDGMVLKLEEALQPFFEKEWPKESFDTKPRSLHFSVNMMDFMVHDIDKTGKIAEEAHKTIGPKHDGLWMDINIQSGKYDGEDKFPQSVRHPYWTTLVYKVDMPNNKGFAIVKISHGSKISANTLSKIQELIEKTVIGK